MDVTPQGSEQLEVQTELKIKKNKWSLITDVVLVVITIGIAVMLIISHQQIKSLETEITNIKNENTALKKDVDEVKGLSQAVDLVRFNGFKNTVQLEMSSNEVTDQLVLNKIMILDNSIIADVDTQPPTVIKYKGYGKFDMQDREVKGMVTDLLEKSKADYNIILKSYSGKIQMPDWEKTPIIVTIKNYEIGTYRNGKFILKGETN